MSLGVLKETVNIYVVVKCCNLCIQSSLKGGVEWGTSATESHAMLCMFVVCSHNRSSYMQCLGAFPFLFFSTLYYIVVKYL
jgi:hypothetical protein